MSGHPRHLPLPLHGLEHVAPHHLPVLASLHRRRQPWQGQWQGQRCVLTWQAAAPAPQATVGACLGSEPLALALPAELLAGTGVTVPGSEAGSLLLEAALLPLIEPLEAATGLACSLHPAASGFEPFLTLHLSLSVGDAAPLPLHVLLSQGAAQALAGVLDRLAPAAPAPWAALRLPAWVSAGVVPLTLADLRSLRPGDVVMFDHEPVPTLRCAPFQAPLRRDGNTVYLLQPLTSRMDTAMTETPALTGPDQALDDLALTLTCQVGRVELTLGQLRELGEGSVLALNNHSDDGVDLIVNGQRIGQGRLVRIGDGLGVRVLSFASL